MRLKIWQAGEAVLRKAARPLTPEEIRSEGIQGLIDSMRETMRDAPGVGLAAPQVGVPLRLAVLEDPEEYIGMMPPERAAERGRRPVPFHVIVNPELFTEGEETAEFFEGCLSVAGWTAMVRRALRVRVECLNERGEAVTIRAEGWYARILQHEIDHLNGTLYVDRMWPRSFMTTDNYGRYWKNISEQEFRKLCG
jgi:peptide deformylase